MLKSENCDSDYASMHAQSIQLCPTLCDLVDHSPPGSLVDEIFSARILEWGSIPSSKGSSQPRDRTHVSYITCIAGVFFTAEPLGKPVAVIIKHIKKPTLGQSSHMSFLSLWTVPLSSVYSCLCALPNNKDFVSTSLLIFESYFPSLFLSHALLMNRIFAKSRAG